MNNALIASFWESGWFGKAILIILFSLSIYAWAVIAMKWRMLREIDRESKMFLDKLNKSGGNILDPYRKGIGKGSSPFQILYQNVCSELAGITRTANRRQINNIQLNMLVDVADRTISGQLINLEKYLIVLATTASISPLLGLLGTVWGVLISFRGMSILGNVSLSVVAPGISEALVTTVAGLIVAIPALVGYNWITNRLKTINRELENFSSRLLNYIQTSFTKNTTYEKEPAL